MEYIAELLMWNTDTEMSSDQIHFTNVYLSIELHAFSIHKIIICVMYYSIWICRRAQNNDLFKIAFKVTSEISNDNNLFNTNK